LHRHFLVVALLIGLLPIMWIWRANLQGAIHLRSRQSSAGRCMRSARSLLVTAQVALALVSARWRRIVD